MHAGQLRESRRRHPVCDAGQRDHDRKRGVRALGAGGDDPGGAEFEFSQGRRSQVGEIYFINWESFTSVDASGQKRMAKNFY